jgi:hypothetical protein
MKRLALPLILILGAVVAAQVSSSLPSSAPATEAAAPQTAPARPVTLPTTGAAAETMLATTGAAATEPTTSPAPTTGVAATGPSSQPYVSGASSQESSPYPYARRNRFGDTSAPPTSTYAADNAGMPDLTPKPYPMQYSAVLNRSIFIKGSQRVIDPGAPRPVVPVPNSGNTGTSGPNPNAPEALLVFNGASDVDGQLVAFIENTGMNQISRYHVGDLVGQNTQGKIAAITLDSMDYQIGTKITHVMLGQNLYGQETQILTTQPVFGSGSVASGGAGPTTGPASTSGGPTDSILERLRKRRMQELGQ